MTFSTGIKNVWTTDVHTFFIEITEYMMLFVRFLHGQCANIRTFVEDNAELKNSPTL